MAINWEIIPSPCFVLEEARLRSNLEIINRVQKEAGVKVIMALKGVAMHSMFPIVREYLPGIAASSLNEVLLGKEKFGSEIHTYCPAYVPAHFEKILANSTHLTFNSVSEWKRYSKIVQMARSKVSCGIRVNPVHSEVKTELYNPSRPGCRLGVRPGKLESLPDGMEGIHFHNLCEGDSYALERTLGAVEEKFGHLLSQAKWVNMGGGHLMTRQGYNVSHLIELLRGFKHRYPHLEVIMEPGAAIAWETGFLVAQVLDILDSDGVSVAMLDVSIDAHMPDCLQMPYNPTVIGADYVGAEGSKSAQVAGKSVYQLGGLSCLAGDYLPEYAFNHQLCVGEKIVFCDMIHYTMVKTTNFNGVQHPSIAIWRKGGELDVVKRFGYEEYRDRLS